VIAIKHFLRYQSYLFHRKNRIPQSNFFVNSFFSRSTRRFSAQATGDIMPLYEHKAAKGQYSQFFLSAVCVKGTDGSKISAKQAFKDSINSSL
jgi:hypothetical protein